MTWEDVKAFDDDYPLSPSALKTYMRCPKQFEFAYIMGIKNPPNFKMAFGSSVHKGIEVNYAHKFTKKKDLPVEDVQDAFRSDIRKRVKEEDVAVEQAELGRAVDEGVTILDKYVKTVAPAVQPIFEPELELIASVPGAKRKMRGFIDLIADVKQSVQSSSRMLKSVVRDTKTTSRMYTQMQADTDPQLTVYAYLLRATQKAVKAEHVQFDVIVRKSNAAPECRSLTSKRDVESFKRLEQQFTQVESSIRSGVFYPTDNHQTCSWCGYRDRCWGERAKTWG